MSGLIADSKTLIDKARVEAQVYQTIFSEFILKTSKLTFIR